MAEAGVSVDGLGSAPFVEDVTDGLSSDEPAASAPNNNSTKIDTVFVLSCEEKEKTTQVISRRQAARCNQTRDNY